MRDPDQSEDRTPSQRSPEVRASDEERDRAIELLQQHAASGRLTPSELEERTENAYAAKTRADLAALMKDLPMSAGTPCGSWQTGASLTRAVIAPAFMKGIGSRLYTIDYVIDPCASPG